MTTLVIADVHLKVSPSHRDRVKAFARFLRSIDVGAYPRILILGDLFDFWFEYRHVVFSGYFDVLRALAELRERGADVHLVCGNHDFWAGRFLRDELGIVIHRDGVHFEENGQRVFFVHGDGVNEADRGYLLYKRVAQSWWAIGLFRLLHPDWAMAIAQAISHGSRTMLTRGNPAETNEAKAIRAFARGVLVRGDADVVVCGHTHFPERMTVPIPGGEGLYINAGDWMERRACLEWKDGVFHHLRDDAENGLVPLEAHQSEGAESWEN